MKIVSDIHNVLVNKCDNLQELPHEKIMTVCNISFSLNAFSELRC